MSPSTATQLLRKAAIAVPITSFAISILTLCVASAVTPLTFASNQLYDVDALRHVASIINVLYPATHSADSPKSTAFGVYQSSRSVDQRLSPNGGYYRVESRAWYAETAAPTTSAIQKARSTYGIAIGPLSSSDGDGALPQQDEIQSFVGMNIHLPASTEYVVASRSALADQWVVGFSPDQTADQPFYGAHGRQDRPFLNATLPLKFAVRRDGTHVRIPLRGDFALWLFEGSNSDPRDLWREVYSRDLDGLAVMPCAISIPRFEATSPAQDLLALIDDGGLPNSPRFNTSRPPSLVLQAARISVNENGVSTSSTTAAMRYKQITLNPQHITINHPFAFAIVDEQRDNVIFVGSISDLN